MGKFTLRAFLVVALTAVVLPQNFYGGGVSGDVSNVYLFPSPFQPFGANAGTGAGETGTLAVGVTFTNLPTSGDIKIFGTNGQLRRHIEFSGLVLPNLSWDFTAGDGRLLGDDVYYAVISSGTNSKTIYFSKGIGDSGITLYRSLPGLPTGTLTIPTYDAVGFANGSFSLVVKGTEEGKVTVVGGAKGFVNPKNGETLSVGAKATGAGNIRTTIYDGKGRQIKSFNVYSDGAQPTVVQWDGKDSSGNAAPSGLYLVHVDGPGINITKRTVIIK